MVTEFKSNMFVNELRYFFRVTRESLSSLLEFILKRDKKHLTFFFEKYCGYDRNSLVGIKKKKSVLLMINALEVLGMNVFCKNLKILFPDHNLIIATDNFDSYEIARNLNICDLVIFSPWDFKFLEKKMLKIFGVDAVVFVTKIFHPKLVCECKSRGILVGLISGLFISLWVKEPQIIFNLKRIFSYHAYEKLDFISMQQEVHKNDLLNLFKRSDVCVLGDIRQDVSHAKVTESEKNKFYLLLRLKPSDRIIIAAATAHDEELILASYKSVLDIFPDLKLILVPRHLERIPEILSYIKKLNLSFVKLSKINQEKSQIIVVDMLLELGKLYSIADVIIFARTFVNSKGGNSNILEPAVHGKPIIFGKYLNATKHFVNKILEEHPQVQAKDSKTLSESILYFLRNKQISEIVGKEFKKINQEGEKIAIDNAKFVFDFQKERSLNCNICNTPSSQFLFKKYGFDLVKCSSCGLAYLKNPPTQQELKKAYSFESNYHTLFLDEKSSRFRFYLNFAKKNYLLLKKYTFKGRILDVGCSVGLFLNFCKQEGWDTYGIELSEDTARIAKKKYGLNVFNGTLEDSKFKNNFFHVVTLWDVLEHVKDPTNTLLVINKLLKTDGLIMLSTPNIDGLFPKLSYKLSRFINYWPHPEPPHHLFQFSKKTLKLLLNKTGFDILKIIDKKMSYPSISFKNLINSPGKFLYDLLFFPIVSIGPLLKSGDWVVVIAKKRKL